MTNEKYSNNPLVQAVRDYYADKPIDRLTEKFLVEICASHAEGKPIKKIANELGIPAGLAKAVIAEDEKHSTNLSNQEESGSVIITTEPAVGYQEAQRIEVYWWTNNGKDFFSKVEYWIENDPHGNYSDSDDLGPFASSEDAISAGKKYYDESKREY